jgi:mycothiol synthase
MFENYYLRRPTPEDIQAVLELMLRCDQRDAGFPDSDLTELRNDWEDINLSQDAWLAIDKQNHLQGYGGVFPWNTGRRFTVYDAPGMEDSDLFLGLTVLCEGRARFLLDQADDQEKRTIATHIHDSADYQKRILAEAGFSVAKYIFNLHRDLDGANPAPEWPDGIALRTVQSGADDRALHTLVQDAFQKPGRSPQSFAEWQKFMMNENIFIPDLWFLLEKDAQLIGCALCFEYEGLGWVRQLAVSADQRGRGLGRKLLQHAFHVFQKRGFPKVGLAAESENETAINLYTSAGMRKVIHLHEFTKHI